MNRRTRKDAAGNARRGMRRRTGHGGRHGWWWLALAAGLLPAPLPAAASGEGILINEVLADPASDWDGDAVVGSRDDEWVEIVNAGAVPVALDGYRLASADTTWRYGFSGTLDPGAVRVVYGSGSYAWEQANGEPQYGLRLANSGGTITLWRVGADTVLCDTVTYQDHEADDDRSGGRYPDGGPDWRLFDGLNPYSGSSEPRGTGCAPSPGTVVDCPTPVRTGTWGKLKLLYTGSGS